MSDEKPPIAFDEEGASSYDDKFAKLAPVRDALHLLTRITLSELPDDARVLCVGAGTGAELIVLADAFPRWQFTALDPSGPMLAICRQRVEQLGFGSRCSFHEGYLDTLPDSGAFDAATSLLVSHFITEREQRVAFFRQIAHRLRPGGYLVSADLAADESRPEHAPLLEMWRRALRYNDMPEQEIETILGSLGSHVSALPPRDVGALIEESGFDTVVEFFQAGLMHGWFARRPE